MNSIYIFPNIHNDDGEKKWGRIDSRKAEGLKAGFFFCVWDFLTFL